MATCISDLTILRVDLWDDFAVFVQKKSGRIGRLLLGMAELLAGPDMVSIGRHGDGAPLNSKTPRDHWDMEPTEKELATVKREV